MQVLEGSRTFWGPEAWETHFRKLKYLKIGGFLGMPRDPDLISTLFQR